MTNKRVAIIAGARTPFIKSGTVFKNYTALDLGVHATKGLLAKFPLDPQTIQSMVFGTVLHHADIPNIAREIVFFGNLPFTLPAHTVSNNCITGIVSMSVIHDAIATGEIDIGIAGGVEAMSDLPFLWNKKMSSILSNIAYTKTWQQKFKELIKIRPSYFIPQKMAIAEPSTGLTMGEHCEIMAKDWHIGRKEQDEVAYRSQIRAAAATKDGRLPAEIYPLDNVKTDLIIRGDTTLEKLAKLPPVFDRSPSGTITAGNSSPITDGAAAVLLASEEYAKKMGWQPLAYIKGYEYSAIDPKDGLLMAPALAVPRLLRKLNLQLSQMELIDMHEAFAAQILCNLKAWQQGWKEPAIGAVNTDILNVMGGSIAVGHPFAATGGRIAMSLATEMQRRGVKLGLISICAAGAMAAAMVLERD